MSKSPISRATRVADQIRMEVADILSRKIKDPRVHFVTVTDVSMTADLRIARVYVTARDSDHFEREVGPGLKSAAGFIRSELGRRLNLRYTPELSFFHDISMETGQHMDQLLDSLHIEKSDVD